MEGEPGEVTEVIPLDPTAPPGRDAVGFGEGEAGSLWDTKPSGSGGLTTGEWDEPLLYHQRGHRTTALQHGHHLVVRAVPVKQRWPRRAWPDEPCPHPTAASLSCPQRLHSKPPLGHSHSQGPASPALESLQEKLQAQGQLDTWSQKGSHPCHP